MKRIMPLLMLLFLVVGGAWAQAPVPGKWYRVKDNSRNQYLTIRSYNQNSTDAHGTVPLLDKDETSTDQVWQLLATETENAYKLQSKSGYYMQLRSWNVDAVSSGGSDIIIEPVDNGYYLKKNATNWFKTQTNCGDGTTAHPFCNAPVSAAATWSFEEVPEATISTFTYNYIYNGESKGTEEMTAENGYTFPAPTMAFPPFVKYTLPAGTVSTANDGQTIDIVLENDFPFEVATSYNEAKWYYLNLRRAQTAEKWLAHSETVPYTNLTRTTRIWETPALWAFMGNPFDGIQVLNRAAGENYTLGYDEVAGGTAVHMTEGITTWTIGKADNNGGFTLHIPVSEEQDNDHLYVHDLNNTLKIWNAAGAKSDNGSIFHIQAESDVFFQRWGNHYPWTTDVLTKDDVPAGVNFCTGINDTDEHHSFRKSEEQIRAIGGNITITFTYKSGNHMLKIAGVDIVDENGTVVKSDYHEGTAGTNSSNNTYTLANVPEGTYILRYFVVHCAEGSTSLHDLTKTNGEILVTGADLVEINKFIYRFILDGDIKVTEEHDNDVNVGEDFPTITTQFPYGIKTPTRPEGHITLSDVVNGVGVKIIELEESLPFVRSKDFASATWYYMNIRSNNKRWVAHQETFPYVPSAVLIPDYNGQWAFVGDPFSGFSVLNRAVGEGYTLGHEGDVNASTIHMKKGTTLWNMDSGSNGFALRMPGTVDNYVNHFSSDSLKTWKSAWAHTDAGSAFNVEPVEVDNHVCYQTWGNHYPWTTDDVTDAPVGVCSHSQEGVAHVLRKAETRIKAAGGDMTVTFRYRDGGHMLMIVGVDLVNAAGEVVKHCYQEGMAGGNHSNNVYTLPGVEAGEYTLRYFVCDKKTGSNSHDLNHTNGTITITGADLMGVDVVYRFTIGGVEKAREVQHGIDLLGTYPDFVTDFPYGVDTPAKPEGIVCNNLKDGVATVDIEIQQSLPFTISEDFASAKWHVIDMHCKDGGATDVSDGTHRYVWTYYADGTTPNVLLPKEETKQTDVFGDDKLWCFIGNVYDGFKIYNKAAGEGLTLNKNADGEVQAQMSDAAQATAYHVVPTATNIAGAICFRPEGHSSYVNIHGSNPKYLSGWTAADGGSSCRIFAPTDFVKEMISAEIELCEGIPVYGVVGSKRALNEASHAVLTSVLEAIQADAWNTEAITPEVVELLTTLAANELVTLRDGGYYFIKNTGEGGAGGSTNNGSWYASYGANGVNFMAAALADGEKLGAKHVWKLEAAEVSEGVLGYKLLSCNLGKYATLANAPTVSQVTSDSGNPFTITRQENSYASIIKENDNRIMRTENDGRINFWSVESDETWYIIEAADMDIVVSEAAGYATIHLPFAVTVPEGLKAYSIDAADNETATLVAHGDIPANTGAVLKGAGTHKLAIVGAAESDWADNMLLGSNVTEYVQGAGYVLSNPVDGGVGLYRATLNKDAAGAEGNTHFMNNANKAYLPGTVVSAGARFFLFDFGGETAIESVAAGENTDGAVVYDIAGRRVEKARKGLYIVNGKKVIK